MMVESPSTCATERHHDSTPLSSVAFDATEKNVLALAQEDSFDDICEQIRRLRASVLPEGTPLKSPLRNVAHSQSADELEAIVVAAQWEGRGHPELDVQSPPAHADSVPGGDVNDSRLRPSNLGAAWVCVPFQLTLWEERQLVRCFYCWCRWCRAERQAAAQRGGLASRFAPLRGGRQPAILWAVDEASKEGAALSWAEEEEDARRNAMAVSWAEEEEASRQAVPMSWAKEEREVHLASCLPYFREWAQLCAAHRAADLANSVQFLDVQVRLQLRTSLDFWRRRAQQKRGVELLSSNTLRKRNILSWWHGWAARSRRLQDLSQSLQLSATQTQRGPALAWWRAVAVQARQADVLQKEAHGLQRTAQCGPAFTWWHTFAEGAQRRALAEKQAHISCKSAKQRRAVYSWHQAVVRSRKSTCENGVSANYRRSQAISWWHQVAACSRRRAQLAQKFFGWNRFFRLRRALSWWMQYSQGRLHRRRRCGQVRTQNTARQQRSVLHWLSRWKRTARKRAERIVALFVHPRLQQEAFETWAMHVRREQRHQAALHRAGVIMGLSLKCRTLHCWADRAKAVTCAQKIIMKFAVAWEATLGEEVFASWHDAVVKGRSRMEAIQDLEQRQQQKIVLRCLLRLNENARERRWEMQHMQTAQRHEIQGCLSKWLAVWRREVQLEHKGRLLERSAEQNYAKVAVRRCYWRWRSLAREIRVEARHERKALNHRDQALCCAAWGCLRSYLHQRRAKRHAKKAWQCKAALCQVRRYTHFTYWKVACAARLLQPHSAKRIARMIFTWWTEVQARRGRGRLVEASQSKTRRSTAFRLWRVLRSACRVSRKLQQEMPRHIWAVWRFFIREQQRRAEALVLHGLLLQQQRLLGGAFTLWQRVVLEKRRVLGRASSVARALETVTMRMSGTDQVWALDRWRDLVDNGRARDSLTLLARCLDSWVTYRRQQMQKQSVRVLCDRYRRERVVRQVLAGWRTMCARLTDMAKNVVVWVASRATRRVQLLFRSWQGRATQAKRCARALTEVQTHKRACLLASWRCAMVRRLACTGIVTAVTLARRKSWVRAWRNVATISAARRLREAEGTKTLQDCRLSLWLGRWCEAGRLRRLTHVAKAWDDIILNGQLARTALMAWSATMALYSRAEAAAATIGALRAHRHLQCWSRLFRVTDMHSRFLVLQALLHWRTMPKLGLEQQQRLLRLQAICTAPALRQLQAYRRYRAQKRLRREEQHNTHRSQCRHRQLAGAVNCWRGFAVLERRDQQQEKAHGPVDANAEEAKVLQVRVLQCRRYVQFWQLATLHQRALAFQASHPRLAMEVSGLTGMHLTFAALFRFWHKRASLRAAEAVVRTASRASSRSLFLSLWVEAYEAESSAFYALQILGRRILAKALGAWRIRASFNKRYEEHVTHALDSHQVSLLQTTWQLWAQRVHMAHVASGFWLERRQQWSSALLLAWWSATQEARDQRGALQQLRCWARSKRSRRKACHMLAEARTSLLHACLHSFAAWAQRSSSLRILSSGLAANVTAKRRRRRFDCWALNSSCRAHMLQLLDHAYQTWVTTYRVWRQVSSRASLLSAGWNRRCIGIVLLQWSSAARHGQLRLQATRSLQNRRSVQRGCDSLKEWRAWTFEQRSSRDSAMTHRARWDARRLQPCMSAWRVLARRSRSVEDQSRQLNTALLWACWRGWILRVLAVAGRRREAAERSYAREKLRHVARAWFLSSRKQSAAARLARGLEQAQHRWLSQEEWTKRASEDSALQVMFRRFHLAFTQRHTELCLPAIKPYVELAPLAAIISLVWERQQLSVALGRLKGYRQEFWVLDAWPAGPYPLLSPHNPYYTQAELRLAVVLAELEAEQSQERAVSTFRSLCQGGGVERNQSGGIMWHALADLVVIHHPAWPSHGRQAIGVLARHEGDSAAGCLCSSRALINGKESMLPHFGSGFTICEE